MVIDKIINNNIVSAFDEKGLEVVIMGRGIGFQMKRGQEVPAEKIEKVFRIKSQSIAEQLKDLSRFRSRTRSFPMQRRQ